MSKIPFVQIDAFADKPFEGNQACVMPLQAWLADDVLQAIAAENNVAETAYLVADGPGVWQLRWFTPTVEVPLCGHATLAAAHYLFAHAGFNGETITFETRQSGALYVTCKDDGGLEMDFPAPEIRQIENDEVVAAALGAKPVATWGGPFYGAVFETVEDILRLTPDLKALSDLGIPDGWGRGNFGCLAFQGDGVDVTSRFFAPGSGIDEDPATGSWHTMVAAMGAAIHGKENLKCYQAYPGRGAKIETELAGDRVKLRGRCVTVIEGVFILPD